jgi:hypothetical protein
MSLATDRGVSYRRTSQAPSSDRLLAWLTSPDVVGADGAVLSWHNPARTGYRYPEVAGLWLSLQAREASARDVIRDRVACGLLADVHPSGGVGKEGREYAFDTAIALSGLVAYERNRPGRLEPNLYRRMFEFIANTLSRRRAMRTSPTNPEHWSQAYGCHLLKTVRALIDYGELVQADPGRRLIDQLVRDLLPLLQGGRFVTHSGSSLTYAHAHCYAIEGLLCLQNRLNLDVGPIVSDAALWLASVQTDDGGIRPWHDGVTAYGEIRADATAQAVRIWTCVDPKAFARPIAQALGMLGRLQGPAGGIRYSAESNDLNTWSTIFAAQANQWASVGGNERWIA